MSACYGKFNFKTLPASCNGEECEACMPKESVMTREEFDEKWASIYGDEYNEQRKEIDALLKATAEAQRALDCPNLDFLGLEFMPLVTEVKTEKEKFWDAVKADAEEVKKLPEWKRAGISSERVKVKK